MNLRMVVPTEELAKQHYADLSAKPFFPGLVEYFTSGPVVAMVWEGEDVILGGRKLVGATNPKDSAPGTIRGDFCIEVGRNIIHGSDGKDSAAKEIALWFPAEQIPTSAWTRSVDRWIYEKPL